MHGKIRLYGWLMVLLGVIGYFLTGRVSVTALIPAFLGIPALALAVPRTDPWQRRCVHLVAVLAVVAIAGSVSGILALPSVLDGTAARPAAVLSRSILFLVSALFLVAYAMHLRSGPPTEGEPPPQA